MARTNGGFIGIAVPMVNATASTTTFNSSGTLTATGAKLADVLVVAGGGGGGDNSGPAYGNGGGGGGGFRNFCISVSADTAYGVVVGAGGSRFGSGSNSSVACISATGGGLGGRHCTGTPGGNPGGSGGGAAGDHNAGCTGNAGGYTPSEGNKGGNGGSGNSAGGGGGGAGSVGSNASGNNGGNGGNGAASSITGSPVTYSGGGGGGRASTGSHGSGGPGGGGDGTHNHPVPSDSDGDTNTGGGGGANGGSNNNSASGGSGRVIVKQQAGFFTSGVFSLKTHFVQKTKGVWS